MLLLLLPFKLIPPNFFANGVVATTGDELKLGNCAQSSICGSMLLFPSPLFFTGGVVVSNANAAQNLLVSSLLLLLAL